jgi:hypothetical protein
MKNTTKQVEQLLRDYPETRDNFKKLIRKALQEVYGINVLSALIIAEHYSRRAKSRDYPTSKVISEGIKKERKAQ